jgi:hypothetical protein
MIAINPIMDNMTVRFWSGRLLATDSWTGARSVGLADTAESDVAAGGVRKDPTLRSTNAFRRITAMVATRRTTNNLPVILIQEFIHPKICNCIYPFLRGITRYLYIYIFIIFF